MLLRTIFAGLRSLCSVRNAHSPHCVTAVACPPHMSPNAHSPHCVTAVACPPHMSPYKRDLPQGSPLHPVFLCLRPDEKCCCAPFLPDSVPCAPCAMRTHRTASQQSLVRRTCRRTSGICRRVTPAPRFCVSGQTKNVAAHHFCRTPFLVFRAQCALTALRHKIFFCATSAVLIYLSSRSGRRSLVISNAFFARQASTSWWLPETSTSGTDSPLYTCGRV